MALKENFCLHCWKSVTTARCDCCTYKVKIHREIEDAAELLLSSHLWITKPSGHDSDTVIWACPNCQKIDHHKEGA